MQPEEKISKYENVLKVVAQLAANETDQVARMANVAALLKEEFGFWWVGFYRVVGDELVLGPFQGPLACTRIKYGRGVCGTAWQRRHTIVVDDVEQFPGHIACSSASRSEIVVPVFDSEDVSAVLDIDSEHLAHFDQIDAHHLELLTACLIPVA